MKYNRKRLLGAAWFGALAALLAVWFVSGIGTAYASGPIPAFPGAEGFGMYATGGRGGDVYEVTNLNDNGPGSLRDAVSQSNRTVVFRVSGTIELKSALNITSSNLTIAGQTAPGDGIAVIGNNARITNASNIIMRYMRFRLGDMNSLEQDTFYMGNVSNVIIDHCSFLWGVDEVLSAYPNESVTVQWSIIGEAMSNSVHSKGNHGFGGIWGSGTSYHHNLIVHNSDRNPRFMSYLEPPYPNDRLIDFRNNVVFDWGAYTSHSGQGLDFNMINNYYKWGPSTREERRDIIFNGGDSSTAYIHGNYVDGSPDVTADNSLGVKNRGAGLVLASAEIARSASYPSTTITTHTAEEAYALVLEQAGATLPKRDSAEARILADVQNRTGRIIDSQRDVGGYPTLVGAPAPADTDQDGMPDDWETAQGLNPGDDSDRNNDPVGDGYTNLERYMNAIAPSGSANPLISLLEPALDSHHTAGGAITIRAAASDSDGTIAKVEFYANDVKLGESAASPYSFVWTNVPEGTYSITAKAVDNSGTSTSTSANPVYIDYAGEPTSWLSVDIGSVGIGGHSDVTGSVYTVKSAGSIGGTSDAFHFMYRPLEGNGEMIARLDGLSRTNQQLKAGLMIRELLGPTSRMSMIALDRNGTEYNPVFYDRASGGAAASIVEDASLYELPYWLRLVRLDESVTAYVSSDGASWKKVGQANTVQGAVYMGFAADPAQEPNLVQRYVTSRFSNVTFRPIAPVPDTPEQVRASRSAGDIRLDWLPAGGATGYIVKRGYLQGGPYVTVGTSVYATYTDTAVQPGVNYFYTVSAVNEYGESLFPSEEASGALLGTNPLTYKVHETFEQATPGSISPPGMKATPVGSATNYIQVAPVPASSIGNGSSQVVELVDQSTGQTAGNAAFAPQSGVFVAEADFMLPAKVAPIRALKAMNAAGNRPYVELLVYNGIGCAVKPCFSYHASDGNYYALPGANSFAVNQWYTIKAVVDVPNETATVTINGQPAGTIPFYYASGWTAPSNLGMIGASTASSSTTSVYWDNVKIGVFGLPAAETLTAASAGSGAVQLTWSAVPGAQSYNVYRYDPSLGRYMRLAAGVGGISYTDTGLVGGHPYTYTVAAVHPETGEGEYASPAEASPGL